MQWRTHILAGLGSLWLLELIPPGLDSNALPLCLCFAAFGALLPDLDANESKIKHLSWAGIQPFALPARAIYRDFGHRGFFHSISGLALLSIVTSPLAFYLGVEVWLALLVGYASHIAADACTRSGVPLLYVPRLHPDRRRYHLLPRRLRFVTGSEAEDALLPLLALLIFLLLLRHLSTGTNLQLEALNNTARTSAELQNVRHLS